MSGWLMNLHAEALELVPVKPEDQRRVNRRFPVEVDITYQLRAKGRVVQSGPGHTVEMSSSGILINTETALPAGAQIELFVAWPAKLNHQIALNLYVRGRTLRSDGQRTAVAIRRHEFRTRRTGPDDLVAAPVRILSTVSGKSGECALVTSSLTMEIKAVTPQIDTHT
jgi:hypothetical protein